MVKHNIKYSHLSLLIVAILLTSGCRRNHRQQFSDEIYNTEKAFEKMAAEEGIATAFYRYADDHAVIKRENDTLIKGKENIKSYYEGKNLDNVILHWTPEFIEVSTDGDLGYSYGHYTWITTDNKGDTLRFSGIFHTVWKRQKKGSWKYVWD